MANADLAYRHALDHLAAVGFADMTEQERDIAALWQIEAEVTNGGFVRYYSGARGDLAGHAADALARLGATGKAAIVRAANALFGPAGPPRDRRDRQAVLETLDDGGRAAIDDLEDRYVRDPVDVDELVDRLTSPAA